MNNKTNYRLRLFLTIAGVIVTYLISYSYSFSESLKLKNDHFMNLNKIQEMNNAPRIISNLTEEISLLDETINLDDTASQNSRKRIIECTESNCKRLNLSLIEITEPLVQLQENYKLIYNRLVIEGDYFQMLKFIYELETITSNIVIISVRIYSKKERSNNDTKIYSEIVFQTIKDKESDDKDI